MDGVVRDREGAKLREIEREREREREREQSSKPDLALCCTPLVPDAAVGAKLDRRQLGGDGP